MSRSIGSNMQQESTIQQEMSTQQDSTMDRLAENDWMNERICGNCNCFFHHYDDDDNLGICSMDEGFAPYWDDEGIMEQMDFTCCRDLYLSKRFDDTRIACESFEIAWTDAVEAIDDDPDLQLKAIREADTSKLDPYLCQPDRTIASRALNQIAFYARNGNQAAYTSMISYYQDLGPATSLEEANFRVEFVDTLATMPNRAEIIDLFIRELARTPSNAMTRSLYTRILKKLGHYRQEEIREPIAKLLKQVTYSYKIKRRIKEVAGLIEPKDHEFDWGMFYP